MRRCYLLLSWLLLVSSSAVYATAQIPDQIELDGKTYELLSEPLNDYLYEVHWQLPEDAEIHSGNWRGYIASWAIQEGQLVLLDAVIRRYHEDLDDTLTESLMPSLFPDQQQVIAVWFSGTLVVPTGPLREYVHMGYQSSYERYTVLEIAAGKVTAQHDLNYQQFRDRAW